MKKFLMGFVLICIMSLSLAGCAQAPQNVQTKQSVSTTEATDQFGPPGTSTDYIYGTSVVFPASWGNAGVEINPNYILYTSKNNPNLKVKIMVTDPALKWQRATDTSIEWLGQNSKYAFYYIKSEMNADDLGLLKTFKAVEPSQWTTSE